MRTRENIEKDDKGGRGCAISAQAELTDFETQLCLRNFFYCNDDDASMKVIDTPTIRRRYSSESKSPQQKLSFHETEHGSIGIRPQSTQTSIITSVSLRDSEYLTKMGETDTTRTSNDTPNNSLLVEGESFQDIPVTPVKLKEALQSPSMYICQPCEPQSSATEQTAVPQTPNQSTTVVPLEFVDEPEDPKNLQVGDHVYQWRSWGGIPGVFQHHGIVMDIQAGMNDDESTKLTIADFSNVEQEPSKANNNKKKIQKRQSGLFQEGILRTYTDTDKWHKVIYEANWWKRSVFRAGTCTSAKPDSTGLVLARVNFIIQYPELLPDYHVVYANCECVAFWCKTGEWSTLQASSFLELTAAGQAKQSATLAATAASTQVSVPAAGVWGWFGYTSNVSWLSLHPMVIPALAGYAAFTIGTPAMIYFKARGHWKKTTKRLSDAFWESAMEQPDVFAECMTHWSEKV